VHNRDVLFQANLLSNSPAGHPNLTHAGLGRPPTGKLSKNVRLSPETIAAVRKRAAVMGDSFSEALETLAKKALGIED
jgi:hypothetical protein